MPLVIGLAGGSGSGKTTVVRRIVEALGDEHVTVLDHDRYYRDHPELRLEERAALNYDHPDSLETELMVRHVEQLEGGAGIDAPMYDFTRHARATATERFEPRTALIVEGILVFADKRLRELMDIKIFVDADDDIRFIRRLERDTSERGAHRAVGDRSVPGHRQADAPGVRRGDQAPALPLLLPGLFLALGPCGAHGSQVAAGDDAGQILPRLGGDVA